MDEVDPLDLVETIREGLLVLEPDLTVRFANRSFCNIFAVAREDPGGTLTLPRQGQRRNSRVGEDQATKQVSRLCVTGRGYHASKAE
jgi:PAS domain-containing protein